MAAYYNEIDPFAADWLRALIAQGHIADGTVDTRSIAVVDAADLQGFTQCHFFAGIGGWSYALRLAGWPDDRPCWTGSCPCQPFSSAGKQAGFADARDLWPAWFRLLRECRPHTVFGEQVAAAARGAWFDRLSADLEGEDYAVGAAVLGAHSVGAWHLRQRLWFVADAEGKRQRQGCADSAGGGEGIGTEGIWRGPADLRGSDMADPPSERRARQHPLLRGDAGGRDAGAVLEAAGGGEFVGMGDSDQSGPQGRQQRWDRAGEQPSGTSGVAGSVGESNRAREAPSRGLSGGAIPQRERSPWAEADWIPCRDGKSRPVEPGTFPLAHGVSARVGRLRGYGNAIVPQVAAEFIASYLDVVASSP